MASPDPFQYAIVRVVPRVERGECFNAGVILFCRPRRFLAAHVALDERRLSALAPDVDPGAIRAHLEAIARVAAGDHDAGQIARLPRHERFHWLVAPVEHDHPAVGGAHRHDGGSRRRAASPVRDDGRLRRLRSRTGQSA